MDRSNYTHLDEAFDMLTDCGPDMKNGFTNHGPMAAEALCALGRADAVLDWVENYRRGGLPWAPSRQTIDQNNWREALAREDRISDWRAFFHAEMQGATWQEVLNRWAGQLAPGICAAAAHGVIRVGHAARALGAEETALRRAELADALASWAYAYQELPTQTPISPGTLTPHQAFGRVPLMPPEQRRFSGTIVSSLYALNDFPAFAPVIGLIDVRGEPQRLVGQMTEVFARVYLENAKDVLTSIVFIHGVTGIDALGNMLPYLDDATARTALGYAWQASCGLYAAFGTHPLGGSEIEAPRENDETLVEMAVGHGDEHVIKFTEACLHQHSLNPSPAYLAAARHVIDALPRS